jgi:hypothetical protein
MYGRGCERVATQYIDVLAECAQLRQLFVGLNLETLEQKRRTEPGTIQLGDIHSLAEVMDIDF